MLKNKTGLTLLEMIFTITLVVFLSTSISLIYMVSLKGWEHLGHRTDIHEKLHFALERIVRDVRPANALSVSNHALRFTLNEGGQMNSYIYYLYHASNSWPPVFNQTVYELRRSALAGGINGTFTYGSGELIATEVSPPPNTTITSSGVAAFLKLSGLQEGDRLTIRGYVYPRNNK